jgi:GT2 family glycosyltransferase
LQGIRRERRAEAELRFSIIITFHNQRRFIEDALKSALSQRGSTFEIIAVDDASQDRSQETLSQYGDVVRVVCLAANEGACGARNRGAALATGEYLVFLDGDDAFLPWALEVYEQVVQVKRPKLILAGMRWFEGALPVSGEVPKEITLVDYADYLRRDRGFGHSASAMVIARQAFEDVDGWVRGSFPLDDVELAMRLGIAGRTIQIIAPATVAHRAHSSNVINEVSRFLPLMEAMLRREQQDGYPGGNRRRFARRALLGGMSAHWVKRAAKVGLRGPAVKLLAQSLPMISAAVARRFGVLVGMRQQTEKIEMNKR